MYHLENIFKDEKLKENLLQEVCDEMDQAAWIEKV